MGGGLRISALLLKLCGPGEDLSEPQLSSWDTKTSLQIQRKRKLLGGTWYDVQTVVLGDLSGHAPAGLILPVFPKSMPASWSLP